MLFKRFFIFILLINIGFAMNQEQTFSFDTIELPKPATKARFGKIVIYDAQLTSQYLYCEVRVNEFPLIDNIGTIEGIARGSFDFLEFLHNGENEVSIEVTSLGRLDPKLIDATDEEREKYTHDDGYCELVVEAAVKIEDEVLTEEIAYLKVSLDDEMKVQIDPEMQAFDSPFSPSATIRGEMVTRNEIHIRETFKASRTINIKNVPHWSWIDAPKFDDIPNNRAELEEGYREFWEVLNSKDEMRFKEYMALALDELAMGKSYDNRGEEIPDDLWREFYSILGYQELFEKGFEMLPLDFSDYEVKLIADGRIARLIKKGHETTSPIQYIENGREAPYRSNHFFAYIDGKFIPVR